MSADETFVPLADLLRPPLAGESAVPPQSSPALAAPEPPGTVASLETVTAPETVAAIREARLFRARLADALDARLARMLAAISSDVVMREVQIAPVDIARIVAAVVAERGARPLCVRIAPSDRAALHSCDVQVVEDATLDPGDAIVVFGAGEVDARLGVRLAAVLEALR